MLPFCLVPKTCHLGRLCLEWSSAMEETKNSVMYLNICVLSEMTRGTKILEKRSKTLSHMFNILVDDRNLRRAATRFLWAHVTAPHDHRLSCHSSRNSSLSFWHLPKLTWRHFLEPMYVSTSTHDRHRDLYSFIAWVSLPKYRRRQPTIFPPPSRM